MTVRAVAVCRSCQAIVRDDEQVGPMSDGRLVLAGNGDVAVVVRAARACASCGDSQIEIRVERLH